MAKEQGDATGEEATVNKEGPSQFAMAVEVDGLRRTFDQYMKMQDDHNRLVQTNMEQIMGYLTRVAGQPGLFTNADKAQQAQGKEILPTQPPKHNNFVDVSIPNERSVDPTLEGKGDNFSFYAQPRVGETQFSGWDDYGRVHIDNPDKLHQQTHANKSHSPQTVPYPNYYQDPNYYQTNYFQSYNTAPQQPIHPPPQTYHQPNPYQHQFAQTQPNILPPHPTFPPPQPSNIPPHPNNPPPPHPNTPPPQPNIPPPQIQFSPLPNYPPSPKQPDHSSFNQYIHHQQKTVTRGPKLDFPEFDGEDPDGWIRKADRYFAMVGIPPEDRVKVAVMYIKGRAEYWWRGTGCNALTLQ